MAVGFGHSRNNVDDEQRQQRQPVPRHEVDAAIGKPAGCLTIHDTAKVQRARHQQHGNQHETNGQFVRHHLRGGAQRTQKRVLGVGRPARHNDAVHANRGNGHNEQQPCVDIGQHHFGAERHHRPGGQGRHQGDHRRQNVKHLVGLVGHNDFFGKKLEHVGKGLQQAARAYPVGAQANVHGADHFAFPVRKVGNTQNDGHRNDHDLDQ